jgi:hypothetical protein
MDRVRKTVVSCAFILFALGNGSASAECIAASTSSLTRTAEILMLARVDGVRGNPANPADPNTINGTIVNVTVKTLWKGRTPRQIELRQTLSVHEPAFWSNIGKDLVLSVRRLTPQRPLGAGYDAIQSPVTSGFTAEACNWRVAEKVDLSVFGRGRAPNE